jgi:pimeloyl-ACP methyl ester carboxylesterase
MVDIGATVPSLAGYLVAAEAARLRVPILVRNGERDSLLNGQPVDAEQYREAASFAGHVLPGAGHYHNLAPTRQLSWEELRRCAESVIPAWSPSPTAG